MAPWAASGMRWRHIVAGWDGTSASAAATVHAERIAREAGCLCSVLVIGEGTPPVPVSARSVPLTGIASIEVPRWAEANGADVIVLPGSFQTACQSEAIIRRSQVPCLLLPVWQRRFTWLHVALDRTERGLQVLRPSRAAASALNAGMDVVCVTGEGDEGIAMSWLEERAGMPEKSVTVLTGAPVPTLSALMAHSRESVLVLGVRKGRSGSVPESSGVGRSLLRTTDCAFLTVPL